MDNVTPVWFVSVLDESYRNYFTEVKENNYIKLKATDAKLIGKSLRLELKNSDNTSSAYIDVKVKSIG